MKDRHRKLARLVFILAAMVLAAPKFAHSQEASIRVARPALTAPAGPNVIIIGFVGGFVSRNDTKHPEVQFAAYLRDRYPSIHADI